MFHLKMEPEKLRRKICFEAARLLHARKESTFKQARWKAARAITRSYIDSECLPTDLEIREALQQFAASEFVPPHPVTDESPASDALPDSRFDQYYALLEPLDRVQLPRDTHPEGDLLYHSLQVFELSKEACPWDEEFLLAALLHDVGKGVDPYDPLNITVELLSDIVSERTMWFIENLPTQHQTHEGTIGIRARRRLSQHVDGEELRILAHCDSEGRVPGRRVCTLHAALGYIRSLGETEANFWDEQ